MGQPWEAIIKNLKIRDQLVLSYLTLALIPLILFAFVSYQYTKGVLIRNMTHNLEAIADRQADQIRYYIREKQLDVKIVARSPYVAHALESIIEVFHKFGLDSPEYQFSTATLEKFLKYYLQEASYRDMFLIERSGQAVFSVKKGEDLGSNYLTGIYKDTELAKVFDRSITLMETQVSDFAYYPATNEPAIFIAAPILKEDEVLGALVFQLNNDEIYRIINNPIGLQSTGETLIVGKVNEDITYLTPTRLDPYAAFRRKTSLHSKEAEFLKQVINGHNMKGIITDYRDKETLAVGKYFLPELGWGMIVKIDTDEVYAPIVNLKWLATLFALFTALLVILSTYKIANSITKPITYLMQKAHIISEGNLSETIDIDSKNEMGQLALAVNEMTKKLKNKIYQLDNLAKEKALELVKAQDRLVFQEKLASLGALTAGVAHEIKNPLNFVNNFSVLSLESLEDLKKSLSGRTTLIPDEFDLFNALKGNISSILDQGKKADNIVQRMLAHSRLGKGLLAPTNINQLVNDYLDLTSHGGITKDIPVIIDKDLEDPLPQVEAIAEDIGRVLLNIFNNAFYAMGKKRLEDPDYQPMLHVETKTQNQWVEIRIRDNGIGMSKEISKQIFTPFFTTKPPGEGTGLGLTLSYNIIVQEHKGEIEFQTEENKYTEFVIRLFKIAL